MAKRTRHYASPNIGERITVQIRNGADGLSPRERGWYWAETFYRAPRGAPSRPGLSPADEPFPIRGRAKRAALFALLSGPRNGPAKKKIR